MSEAFATIGEAVQAQMEGDGEWLTPAAVYDYYRNHDPNPISPLVLSWHIQNDVENFDTKLVPDPSNPEREVPVVSKRCVDEFIRTRRKKREIFEDGKDEEAMTGKAAYAYYCKKATKPVAYSLFSHYLSYGIIVSERLGSRVYVNPSAIDAMLQSHPTGKIEQTHVQEGLLYEGDLTIEDAYAYFAEHDEQPIQFQSFKNMISNGIIPAIRPKPLTRGRARIWGVKKADVDVFLERRKALLSATTRSGGRAGAGQERRSTTTPRQSNTFTISEAYDYYRSLVARPLSLSWFRQQVREGHIEAVQADDEVQAGRNTWLVDATSLKQWVEETEGQHKPRHAWLSIQEAYTVGRANKIIPPELSRKAFAFLVYDGQIASERGLGKRAPYRVTRQAMEDYFLTPLNIESSDTDLTPDAAYSYYCTFAGEKLSKADFWRLIDQGEIPSAKASSSRNAPKLVSKAAIQAFVAKEVKEENTSEPSEPSEWMTPDEVAALVRVEVEDIIDAFVSGDLPGKKIGKKTRFTREAVKKWLAE